MNNNARIISVVIPTYNRMAMLQRTLKCVVNQELPPDMFEVIVVVDGSTDGSVDWLQGFKARVHVQSSCKRTAARRGPQCRGRERHVAGSCTSWTMTS